MGVPLKTGTHCRQEGFRAHSHVSAQALREYSTGRLPPFQADRLEERLLLCSTCQARSGDTEILGQALRTVMSKAAISLTHDTRYGPIHLLVTDLEQRIWIARFWGRDLDGQSQFDDLLEANQWLVRAFTEIFPQHRCTRRCVRHT